MLIPLFISLVAFSGLFCGYLLTYFAKEEIKPGQKYFIWLRRIILWILAVTLLWRIQDNISLISLVIGGLIGYFLRIRYLYLGLALAASAALPAEVFVGVASLIFLYGLPYGSSSIKIKFPFHTLLFFVPVMVFFFLSPNNLNTLLSFIAGTLFFQKE